MTNKLYTGVLAIMLVGLVAALYGQFLWNPIFLDDLQFFELDGLGHQPISEHHYALFELRSLPYATLAWSKAVFGLELSYFRIENLLLHAAVVVTLFFVLKNLFEAALPEGEALSPRAAAFLAALLFALHPVATFAVGYLVQRTIVMATLFGLLAMLAYLHGMQREKPLWLWMSVVLYFMAVFSKEHIVMLPAVLLALTVLLQPDWLGRLRRNWLLFAAYGGIAMMVVLAQRGVLGSVYEPSAAQMLVEVKPAMAYPLSVLTQSWLFFKYVGLWLLPNPAWMSIDMRESFAPSLWSTYLLAFGTFVAWGAGAVWLLFKRGRLGLLGFAMLFPWLMFMTEFSTVRIQESFVLYRSYPWAVGVSCLIPVLFAGIRPRFAYVLAGFVAVALFVISMERLGTMAHPVLLWDDAEKLVKGRDDLPGVDRIYNNRGVAFLKIGQYKHALADFKHVLVLRPNLPIAYNNIGAIYLETKEWQKAVEAFNQAIEILKSAGKEFDSGKPYYGRALAFEKLGESELAKEDFKVSCRLDLKGCNKLNP